MKKTFLCICFAFFAVTMSGQFYWDLNFDNAFYLNRLVIDTASNPNNIWQVGSPGKTIFISANSSPNVIVTDIANPYPVNDTSSFTVIHIADMGWQNAYPNIYIDGWYFVNSDSLTDYGYIEYSADHGNSWFRADSSSNHNCCFAGPEDLPTLTGNSNGWKHFHYCLCAHTTLNIGDTVLYRFTFISDSIQTNKDGLMFDDLHFEDMLESLPENTPHTITPAFPNPASEKITLRVPPDAVHPRIEILHSSGRILADIHDYNGEAIDLRHYSNGVYLVRYSDAGNSSVSRFVIIH